jgi:hypothetical protein
MLHLMCKTIKGLNLEQWVHSILKMVSEQGLSSTHTYNIFWVH